MSVAVSSSGASSRNRLLFNGLMPGTSTCKPKFREDDLFWGFCISIHDRAEFPAVRLSVEGLRAKGRKTAIDWDSLVFSDEKCTITIGWKEAVKHAAGHAWAYRLLKDFGTTWAIRGLTGERAPATSQLLCSAVPPGSCEPHPGATVPERPRARDALEAAVLAGTFPRYPSLKLVRGLRTRKTTGWPGRWGHSSGWARVTGGPPRSSASHSAKGMLLARFTHSVCKALGWPVVFRSPPGEADLCTGASSYTLDDFVGEGGFGEVYRVRRAGFDLVAKKFDTRFPAREVLGSPLAGRWQRRA